MADAAADPRSDLLARVVDDVARRGLGDRSLREIATSVGSSHRMLLYHFGSREGLVAAIVDAVERQQRTLMASSDASTDPADVVREVWRRVSDPRMRPFVQLFFEAAAFASRRGDAAATSRDAAHRRTGLRPPGGDGALTGSWIDEVAALSARTDHAVDRVDVRLGIAVTRGLLIDIITGGDIDEATKALERFLTLWSPTAGVPRRAGRARS